MKTKLLIALLFFCSVYANAQNHELGKVTIEELQQKFHPKDTAAVAAVLFKTGKTL